MSAEPWYRHFWVWFLFVPPLAAVVFWTVIITVFAGPPALVVDDYAKIGLTWEQQRERDARAADLGVRARLHLARAGGGASVVLLGLEAPPARLDLRLTHPTDPARDRRAELARIGTGVYRGEVGAGADGRWRVQLAPPDAAWRLAGQMFAGQADLELVPPGHLAEK